MNIRVTIITNKYKYMPTLQELQQKGTVKVFKAKKKKAGFAERIARTFLPKGVEGFGETLGSTAALGTKDVKGAIQSQAGLDEQTQKLANAIIQGKTIGKDTSRLERQYERNTGSRLELRDIIGETAEKSTRQIAGEALSTVGTLALGAKPSTSVLGRIGTGGALGTTFGTAGSLIDDDTAANVVTSGLLGGITGLALGGLFEGIGFGVRKIVPKIGKHTFSKELQPPQKELTNQIEMGFQTFGEKVRSIKDVSGKGVYKGTYTTLQKQAKQQLQEKGDELMSVAKRYDKTTNVSKNQVAGDIVERMQNTFGRLKNSQLKAMEFEVARMPKTMNVTEMINNKRMYDKIIPDSFWLKTGNANVAFATQVKYILRDNLRKMINSSADDALVKKLNNELSIAMDVKHLASEQLAKRVSQKISGEGGFYYKLIGRFIDDWILNPAITTRVSQATQRAGQTAGQTPLRSAARGLAIKGATE